MVCIGLCCFPLNGSLLNEGLKSLGRYLHGELCIVSIGVFGISGMTPFLPVAQIPRTSVFDFIYGLCFDYLLSSGILSLFRPKKLGSYHWRMVNYCLFLAIGTGWGNEKQLCV